MTGPAITLAAALVIVFVGAYIAAWWDDQAERREHGLDDCEECRAAGRAHVEPLSRLDRLDGVHERDELWP